MFQIGDGESARNIVQNAQPFFAERVETESVYSVDRVFLRFGKFAENKTFVPLEVSRNQSGGEKFLLPLGQGDIEIPAQKFILVSDPEYFGDHAPELPFHCGNGQKIQHRPLFPEHEFSLSSVPHDLVHQRIVNVSDKGAFLLALRYDDFFHNIILCRLGVIIYLGEKERKKALISNA